VNRPETNSFAEDGNDVLAFIDGAIGCIILNRPKALNALTLEMVHNIARALTRFASNPMVHAIVLSGAGDRGLCAGGDIRALYRALRDGQDMPALFWRSEYSLNAAIARCPKPFVSIMDGIVMGGGVGVSAHGSHRVATDRLQFAMPEVGIGFVPDVGGTFLLSRAPNEFGTYLALTGETINAADALYAGVVDKCVPAHRLGELTAALARDIDVRDPSASVTEIIARFQIDAGAPARAAQFAKIARSFAGDNVEDIVDQLQQTGDEFAWATAAKILQKSPTSLKLALASLRRARTLATLEDCLAMEFRMAVRLAANPNFVEGIRAVVIEKDNAPRWSPPNLGDVHPAKVEAYFANLGPDELWPKLD
jgi:enoyl-CoA hydratase